MLSFLYVYSDHSILECYNLFSGVELSMRSFFVIYLRSKEFNLSIRMIGSETVTQCEESRHDFFFYITAFQLGDERMEVNVDNKQRTY